MRTNYNKTIRFDEKWFQIYIRPNEGEKDVEREDSLAGPRSRNG